MKTAHVVGGSLGGLLAALLLHRAGWRVQVHERVNEPLSGRGAGIVTHGELFEALQACGVSIEQGVGVTVQSRITLAPDGQVLGELPMPQVLTAWGKLYHLLRTALPPGLYHQGAQVVAVHPHDDGAELAFADGRRVAGDLVVAADGIRSTIRQQLLPQAAPQYAGYIAWRGLAPESALQPATRSSIFEKFAFCLPPREQILGYPVAGVRDELAPGYRRFNFVWYRPADEATLADLLTDADGHVHVGGIAPQRIRSEVIATMRADAHRLLAPPFRDVVSCTDQPFFQPIYDLMSPRLVFGRVVLLGDAAFVARPHCGMGVTKAAGDALALARAVDTGHVTAAALGRYEQARLAFGSAVVAHARHLGAYMQAQLHTEAERAAAERYRTPQAVMVETASSALFDAARAH